MLLALDSPDSVVRNGLLLRCGREPELDGLVDPSARAEVASPHISPQHWRRLISAAEGARHTSHEALTPDPAPVR